MIDAAAALLAHGAGSGRDHHSLLAMAAALEPRPTVRLEFPYRREGRRFPDPAPVLVEVVREAAAGLAAACGAAPAAVLLGGRSMGGRMCSMAVAEGLPAAGLVLVSYPLHPPSRPERLRAAHFPSITVPCLFVSGTRDAFAAPDELREATRAIPGPVTHSWIEGGRHELDRHDDEIVAALISWLDAVTP